MVKNSFLFIITCFLSLAVSAFPEMIRNHYVNCSSCHVSQSGGGVLNSYGRSLSYELLSASGSDKEARAFYSIDPETTGTWFNMGGDVRSVQTHFEDATIKTGKWFVMQAGIDIAINLNKWTGMMTLGKMNTNDNTVRAVSPKYYLSYQLSDEFSVRAGRTIPVFGLQIPQHIFLVKDNLLIGEDTERDSVETFWNGEEWNFTAAYAKSFKSSAVGDEEKSVSMRIAKTLNDSSKVGLNFWSGDAVTFKRMMVGVDGVFGFTEKFYMLTEVDHVSTQTKPGEIETKSVYELLKLGYEFKKGVHGQVVQQFGKPNTSDSSIETQSYGLGALWYPRPHFEFEVLWQKQRTLGVLPDAYADFAYLLAHYYF